MHSAIKWLPDMECHTDTDIVQLAIKCGVILPKSFRDEEIETFEKLQCSFTAQFIKTIINAEKSTNS